MWSIVLLSIVALVFASLPLLVSRRHSLLNPATYIWLMVLGSVFAKGWYITLLHPQPIDGRDTIFRSVSSPEFFVVGLALILVAIAAYVAGFFVHTRKIPVPRTSSNEVPSRRWMYCSLFCLLALCIASFFVYLHLSGTSLFEPPFSEKRFQLFEIGATSRFRYLPYYFFKLALTSGSVAFVAALLLFRTSERRAAWVFRTAFVGSLAFYLSIGHFASLRMGALAAVMLVFLLAVKARNRRDLPFVVGVALVTMASLVLITFVYRAPPREGVIVHPTPATAIDSETTDRAREPIVRRKRSLGESAFGGRYFFDFAKLAHLAHHVPDRHGYLLGRAWLGGGLEEEGTTYPADRYLAEVIYGEERNSVPPGFAGELFLNFGWAGVAMGFLLLGIFHRVVFEALRRPGLPMEFDGVLVATIPATTLVLINSGLIPALSRLAIDLLILALVCLPGRLWFLRRSRSAAGS